MKEQNNLQKTSDDLTIKMSDALFLKGIYSK